MLPVILNPFAAAPLKLISNDYASSSGHTKQLNGALQAYEASNPGETVSVIMTGSGQGDAIAPQCGGFASVIRAGF